MPSGEIMGELPQNEINETTNDTFCSTESLNDFCANEGANNHSKVEFIDEKTNDQNFFEFKTPLIWQNIIAIFALHALFVYYFFTFPYLSHIKTTLFILIFGDFAGIGVTGGAHRLYTHRGYKAKTPLKIILLWAFYSSGENSLYDWTRDHRVHHKYSETDADPHNSKRGFFFSHVGWLMMRKHPEVIRCGRQIDMSDITNDPIVAWTEKFFIPIKIICAFVIPIAIPILLWNETFYYAFVSQAILRYVFVLNATWSVNSFAHMYGSKPYDKNIDPVQNIYVSIVSNGEGWHNYHHVFPWDYKAAELGSYRTNLTTWVIDSFAKIGWAYDLKQPSKELIESTMAKKGDGSHQLAKKVD